MLEVTSLNVNSFVEAFDGECSDAGMLWNPLTFYE